MVPSPSGSENIWQRVNPEPERCLAAAKQHIARDPGPAEDHLRVPLPSQRDRHLSRRGLCRLTVSADGAEGGGVTVWEYLPSPPPQLSPGQRGPRGRGH